MNDPHIFGFVCGYLTCAAGLLVGWHVAQWWAGRKAKRATKVDKAAATRKREDELVESLKAFCAVAYPGTSTDFADQGEPTKPPGHREPDFHFNS